jgi:hypothetical protein
LTRICWNSDTCPNTIACIHARDLRMYSTSIRDSLKDFGGLSQSPRVAETLSQSPRVCPRIPKSHRCAHKDAPYSISVLKWGSTAWLPLQRLPSIPWRISRTNASTALLRSSSETCPLDWCISSLSVNTQRADVVDAEPSTSTLHLRIHASPLHGSSWQCVKDVSIPLMAPSLN